MIESFHTGFGAAPGLADGFCRSFASRGSAFQWGRSLLEPLNLCVDRLDDLGRIHGTDYTSATPEPKNSLPPLREKLASFDGAIGADDVARLLQTSCRTIYLCVRQNWIPYFRLNGCVKFDPTLIADWIDSISSTPKKPARSG